jgi:hypothetical protein
MEKWFFLHFVWVVLFSLVDFLLIEFPALRSSRPRPRSGFCFGACPHQPPRNFRARVCRPGAGLCAQELLARSVSHLRYLELWGPRFCAIGFGLHASDSFPVSWSLG